jgi:hypothetical protein
VALEARFVDDAIILAMRPCDKLSLYVAFSEQPNCARGGNPGFHRPENNLTARGCGPGLVDS